MVAIILTHQNADFDAVASVLGAHKLHPHALPILPSRQQRSVAAFLTLYRNGLPFVNEDALNPTSTVEQIILTDTDVTPALPQIQPKTPTLIYEHHALERKLGKHETWAGERVGATTTLLVEAIQIQSVPLTTLEATLMALGIYADTGMFTYAGTTERDLAAAGWLMEQGAALDTVRRFLNEPLNPAQQDLFERLLDQTEHRQIAGYTIALGTSVVEQTVAGINTVTQHLRDLLDPDALFTLVEMPKQIQLVGRSTTDAINAGDVATYFGGGGHPRAAAAAIYSGDLASISADFWAYMHDNVQPATHVADLMSHGVQTVAASARIGDVIHRIRRMGHEGYPVVHEQKVVGLLTLGAADRALEHGLQNALVRAVMRVGEHTLTPTDSVAQLEQLMLTSSWGQIPIVDADGTPIGIVTRTDLIRHWAQIHPNTSQRTPDVGAGSVEAILGGDNRHLIEVIAQAAQTHHSPLYIVGGVVRDLLLQRPNFDIDFVVEGDAIAFVEDLHEQYGGTVQSYRPFGTAKWQLDAAVAAALGVNFDQVPDHLDFATARSELYEHPTALPTVYNSGIKLDLRRRDFTINTLALQISPKAQMWRLLDFYGGQADLEAGIIRVLHSLSFVDDPTRILRAVRFSKRLGFALDPRTTDLITQALAMLGRITGERLRNELSLLLQEQHPEWGLAALDRLGILRAVHPSFGLSKTALEALKVTDYPNWADDVTELRWQLVLGSLAPSDAAAVCERLLFSNTLKQTIQTTAILVQAPQSLDADDLLPSQITAHLRGSSLTSLNAAWILLDDPLARHRLEQYVAHWQHIQPTVDGNTLKRMGVKPGPHYRTILAALRDAWIDGTVADEQQEATLLGHLIREVDA